MNENLATPQLTQLLVNNQTVIYTCWEKKESAFSNGVTLGLSTILAEASRSGVVYERTMDSTMFLCAFISV